MRRKAVFVAQVKRSAGGSPAVPPPARRQFIVLAMLLLLATAAFAQQSTITINDDQPVYTEGVPFMLTGTSLPGAIITIAIEKSGNGQTTADATGHWTLLWTPPVKTGTWTITATSGGVTAMQLLRVQIQGNIQRQPIIEPVLRYGTPEIPHPESYQEMTDRWRIAPPPYELTEKSKGRPIGNKGATLDPYNQNLIKGDLPIFGKDWFFAFTGISDTLAESRTLPTPSGVSAVKPTSITVFGKDNQNLFNENVIASFDLFQGDTAFKPITQRWKATLIGNLNYVHLRENGLVKPDVRRGTQRSDGAVSLQEFFYERKLKDVSPNYDFISIRVGSQPFNSDFRGFLFNDTNLGVRVFGNFASNRYQYNLAVFDRLEKDTNSGLNTMELRDQQVAIANFYWQDFLVHGYTQQFSVHYVRDEATFHYDKNGILVRPAPVGVFTPHEIRATYLGESGLGHIGRFNVDHAIYYVFGTDALNPIAGPDPNLRDKNAVKIGAASAAIEVSYDRDWYRPRLALFYASGDRNPYDGKATGYDAVLERPLIAGAETGYWIRQSMPLGAGPALSMRNGVLPSLRTSREHGQSNFINPGLRLLGFGADADITPRLRFISNLNYLSFDDMAVLAALRNRTFASRSIGTDISFGLQYRPALTQNLVFNASIAALLPGQGLRDLYGDDTVLYSLLLNMLLTF